MLSCKGSLQSDMKNGLDISKIYVQFFSFDIFFAQKYFTELEES